jgi:hypothetical protein
MDAAGFALSDFDLPDFDLLLDDMTALPRARDWAMVG